MGGLYEQDILEWSERQGALLRRIGAGERINDADIDWPNIAEEIESVGRSELAAVKSLLRQAMVHDLKALAWPDSSYAASWRSESRLFRAQARDRFAPSMRQNIDLRRLYADALAALPEQIDGAPPGTVPAECPFTLDELLAEPKGGLSAGGR